MPSEIEKLGLRKAWLTSTPKEARGYLADLTPREVAAFNSDADCVGYLEGLQMLAHMKSTKPAKARLVIEKAILTKPSEAPAKKAPPQSKSVQRKTTARGKVDYRYDKSAAKKPSTKAKKKPTAAKPAPRAAPVKPAGAPPLDVAELAAVLQTSPDTLKQYASGFKTATAFVASVSEKLAPFIRKHNIGPDKLRRLYEQLAHS